MDLDAIWAHQEQWNGEVRADAICDWLIDFAETIVARRWPDAPVPGAKKITKDGYLLLVRESRGEVQIIGVFGPGMNWTLHARDR